MKLLYYLALTTFHIDQCLPRLKGTKYFNFKTWQKDMPWISWYIIKIYFSWGRVYLASTMFHICWLQLYLNITCIFNGSRNNIPNTYLALVLLGRDFPHCRQIWLKQWYFKSFYTWKQFSKYYICFSRLACHLKCEKYTNLSDHCRWINFNFSTHRRLHFHRQVLCYRTKNLSTDYAKILKTYSTSVSSTSSRRRFFAKNQQILINISN